MRGVVFAVGIVKSLKAKRGFSKDTGEGSVHGWRQEKWLLPLLPGPTKNARECRQESSLKNNLLPAQNRPGSLIRVCRKWVFLRSWALSPRSRPSSQASGHEECWVIFPPAQWPWKLSVEGVQFYWSTEMKVLMRIFPSLSCLPPPQYSQRV